MSSVEDEFERISVKDLIEMENTRLQHVLSRAHKSPFYRERWKAVGVDAHRVQGLQDLVRLPFITRKELFQATRTKKVRVACSQVSAWFACPDQTQPYEWFPFSAGDFLEIAPMLARMSRAVDLRSGDMVLAVMDTPPRVSYVIPYLWTCLNASKVAKLEFITGALEWYDTLGMRWIDFVQRRRPTVLLTSTRNALALADKIEKDRKVQAREVLTKTRVGIFLGEPLANGKSKLMEAYDLEPFEVYSPTEHLSFCTECDAHRGIHLWLDTCIPEIIPADREEAIPVWEAAPGTRGELVVTNFAECLPLIRFRTGESICIEGIDRCACGRTHPRISRLPSTAATS